MRDRGRTTSYLGLTRRLNSTSIQSKMIRIGLTGNIASGKSEVARMLADRGATVIDADVLAREAVQPDTQALKDIVKRWGRDILRQDGSLDREALRRIVFADQSELDALNRIVHPGVTRLRDREIARAKERGDSIVVCVIPLLFERNIVEEFDAIVLVDAPRPLRLERLVTTRGLEETDAMNMIAAQMPAELKRARTDYVIENNGSLEDLERDVDALWSSLQRDEAGVEKTAAQVS
ncbi:MAG: dephospho-CoA kinase [Gemmatimonadaceae bacterium]